MRDTIIGFVPPPLKTPWSIRIAAAPLLLLTIALGVWGIQRSLWTDEAWVANSILSPSISGMFYYPEWLQSTPPLFLALMRAAVHAFGASNAAFRIVPLIFAVAGVGCMILLTRRLVSAPVAVLACALLAFHPTVIEYAHTAKQYSAELAASAGILLATACYLDNPSRRRFIWLVGAFVLALPLAWSTVFLLPGVVLAVLGNGSRRRAASLALIFGAVLAILYFAFIRENLSPQLRTFWIATAQKPSAGLMAALMFCVAALLWAGYRRSWIEIAALLPCLLLAAADLLRVYPGEPRTRLFALPCFLLAAAMIAEDIRAWVPGRISGNRSVARLASAALLLIAAGVGSESILRQLRDNPEQPKEDLQGAVGKLRRLVSPRDLLLVHASVLEGFRLYANIEGWRDHHALFGNTGWPCCARGRITGPNSSKIAAVNADVDRLVPSGFTGRVWLFYSARHTHWVYIGNDEGILWRSHLWDRGCPPGPYFNLWNLVICAVDCAHAR